MNWVEPLYLKVLRISGNLILRSSYLNISFTMLTPEKIKKEMKNPLKIIKDARMVGGGRGAIKKSGEPYS